MPRDYLAEAEIKAALHDLGPEALRDPTIIALSATLDSQEIIEISDLAESEFEATSEQARQYRTAVKQFRDGNGAEQFDHGAPRRPPLNLTLARDIKLEPKLYLIEGFLGHHEQSAWFGQPDSGKSTVLVDVGCHVAASITYCGREVHGGAVLYVACERGAVVKRRVKAWCLEHDLPDIPLAVIDDAIDLRTDKIDADRIIAAAKNLADAAGIAVVFIIIDTLNRALNGGDENSSKDMGALLGAVDKVYRATMAHLALAHHTPADRTDRMRGHGSATAAFDMTVAIRRSELAVIVTVEKGNDLVEKPEFRFRFKSVPLPVEPATTAPVLEPTSQGTARSAAVGRPPSRSAKALHDAIVEALDTFGANTSINGHTLRAVDLGHVKEQFERRYVTAEADPRKAADAKRKTMKRSLEHLPAGFGLGTHNGTELVWRA